MLLAFLIRIYTNLLMKKKLISVIIPAYNEDDNISLISIGIQQILEGLDKYVYEIIFVNDWSDDNTWAEICIQCNKYDNIRGVNLSRNFWKEIALTAGLEFSKWDIVITIDADLQHPINKIPDFVKKWEDGFDIVYNKRPKIKWASFFKRFSSKVFYYIFNKISDFKLESSTTDYRLLDRKVVDVFMSLKEKNRMYRWLIDWLWFKKTALVFDALPNKEWRKSSYSMWKLVRLAMNSITSFSLFPLKIVGYLGLFITFFSALLLFIMVSDILLYDIFNFTNLAIVTVINTLLIGIVLMSLWMLALYIANIHEEVLWRPLYVVKDKVNIK